MFDDASVLECYRRAESIVPQQALALSNSQLALTSAEQDRRAPARRGWPARPTPQFIRAAFETVLAAAPTAAEQAECEQAAGAADADRPATQDRPDAARRARADLVHALLNHNDFVTVR